MQQCIGNSISFTGVDQTTPIENGTGRTANAATSSALSVTSGSTDDMVVDAIVLNPDPTVDGSQVERFDTASAGSHLAVSTEGGASGTVTMTWTFDSDDIAHAGVNINAAPVTVPDINYPATNQPVMTHVGVAVSGPTPGQKS